MSSRPSESSLVTSLPSLVDGCERDTTFRDILPTS